MSHSFPSAPAFASIFIARRLETRRFCFCRRPSARTSRHENLPPHPTQGFKRRSAVARSAQGSVAPPGRRPPPPAAPAAAAPLGCCSRCEAVPAWPASHVAGRWAPPPDCHRPATRPKRATNSRPHRATTFFSHLGLVDLLRRTRSRSALLPRR